MSKTLALCIPAYNAERFLPNLFASVKIQDIPFDEILLYDDCSTDNTYGIAHEMGATVIRGDLNKGCSQAKNILANHSTSDWLFFLDSDDELLPGFSNKVRDKIETSNEVDMILVGYTYIDKATGEIKHEPVYDQLQLKSDAIRFMIENKIVNSSVVKRNSFLSIGGFDTDPQILYVEDRAYSIKTALKGFTYTVEPSICFQINYNHNSMSSAHAENWLSATVYLWKKIFKQTGNEFSDSICNQLFLNADWAAKFGVWSVTKKSLQLAKIINPGSKPETSKKFRIGFSIWPFGSFVGREWILRMKQKMKN